MTDARTNDGCRRDLRVHPRGTEHDRCTPRRGTEHDRCPIDRRLRATALRLSPALAVRTLGLPVLGLPALVLLLLLPLLGCPSGTESEPPPEPTPNVLPGPLSPLHAEPDVDTGGRILDGFGREVLLRGANINSLGEYWTFDPDVAPVFPLVDEELDLYAGLGWNVVRLILTWSRVEPAPGAYDEAYLDEVEGAILRFQERGIYTLIDLHQDAWGPSLAAPDDVECPEGTYPAVGWDGAPDWASLHGDASCCIREGTFGLREFSPAVVASFLAFWQDDEGPGGGQVA
jgi:hypothetical protein